MADSGLYLLAVGGKVDQEVLRPWGGHELGGRGKKDQAALPRKGRPGSPLSRGAAAASLASTGLARRERTNSANCRRRSRQAGQDSAWARCQQPAGGMGGNYRKCKPPITRPTARKRLSKHKKRHICKYAVVK